MKLSHIIKPAKSVPKTWWSADNPMSTNPKFSTLMILIMGEFIFGVGDALLISAEIGNTPWTVLAEGISIITGMTVGQATFVISLVVLFLWIPIKEIPGIGTILNAIIIALMIDICIKFVPVPQNFISQLILAIVSVLTVGLGGGIYLVANLGAGPRDGLMVGLQKKTNLPIAAVRAFLEITVVSVGWYLGGIVGVGTLLFAFGIGPAVALGLFLVDKIFN